MRKIKLLLSGLLFASLLQAQETFPVNGVADKRERSYAFTNATIVVDAKTTLANSTLVIRDGKIVGIGIAVPKDAVVIDCKDKYIYPSFIDIYTDYGIEHHNANRAVVLTSTSRRRSRPTPKAPMAGTRPSNQKQMLLKYLQ